MITGETYAEKIKRSRNALPMTRSEFTSKLGVSPVTVCRRETEKIEPSINVKKPFRDFCARNELSFDEKMTKTREEIARNMRSNKSKDTKPELLLRKELWKRGLRYRKNYKKLIGKPDIVFPKRKIAIFVDGKMWHGYDWEQKKNDFKSNRDFWIPKIEENIARDKFVTQRLKSDGWIVLRFWDFDIKKQLSDCADKIERAYKDKIPDVNGDQNV